MITRTGKLTKQVIEYILLYLLPIAGVQEMAAKANSFSKWGYLKQCGLTEGQLVNVIVRSEECCIPVEPPTYGIVLELYYFANEIAADLHRRPNRVLKCLMDTLFPTFSISRADRFQRRVKALCTPLESMAMEELAEYLQRKWIPQSTGVYNMCMFAVAYYSKGLVY